mmetsp:Transcript_65482/g.152011  ORF Transcript_65482/g.152011 Transcript_65482/m.152011 type:complete len:344 (-) Transcript_65482:1189-2220(-)
MKAARPKKVGRRISNLRPSFALVGALTAGTFRVTTPVSTPLKLTRCFSLFALSSSMILSLSILSLNPGSASIASLAKPTIPRALLNIPSMRDFGEKKAAFVLFLCASEAGRTWTLSGCWPGACGGILVTQADTHLPSIFTTQVLHLPFLHLYLMNTSACDATSLRGCPTRPMVMTFDGWKTTGVSPNCSWPLSIVGGSFCSGSSISGTSGRIDSCSSCSPDPWNMSMITSSFSGAGTGAAFSNDSGTSKPASCSSAAMIAGALPEVLSKSLCSSLVSEGVLSSARSIRSKCRFRSSLGIEWLATIFAPAPPREARMRARSSSTPNTDVAAPTTLSVGQGDLGW